MSFLKLDGLTLSVNNVDEEPEHAEKKDAESYDGTPFIDRRGTRRSWSFELRSLTQATAEMIKAFLSGRGEQWRWSQNTYDSGGLLSNRAYGDKGTAPTTVGTEAFDMFPLVAADGDPIYQTDPSITLPGTPWETCRLAVEPTTDNLQNSDARDCENAPTGFNTSTVTLAGDTDNYAQGTKSLKVTPAPSGISGFRTNAVTLPDSTTYTHSLKIKVSASTTFDVYHEDGIGGVSTPTTVTLPNPNTWYRVEVTGTVPAGSGTTTVNTWVRRTGGSYADFWCDCFQIEARDYATTWVDGSRAAGNLRVPATYGRRGVTVAFDAVLPATANNCGLITLSGDSADSIELYRTTSADLLLRVATSGASSSLSPLGSIWDGDLHHVAFAVEDGVESKLYVDGQLKATDPTIPSIDRTAITHAQLGYSPSYTTMRGHMGALRIFPWVASADQINEWYQAEHAPAQWPRVYAVGDFAETPSPGELVEGEWTRGRITPMYLDGAYHNNAQTLQVRLRSVDEL